MSERVEIVIRALWIVHPVLETAIAIVMLRRGQHHQFKYFFAYIVAQILDFTVAFPAYWYQYTYYFYVECSLTAVALVLGFMAIYEAFRDLFQHYHTLKNLGIMLFKWAGLLLLLVAGILSVFTRSPDTSAWGHALLAVRSCLRCTQVGMVLFLLIFARYAGVSRKRQSFGIALGFGVVGTVELAVAVSMSNYRLSDDSLSLINVSAYICPLLIWLGYALKSHAREVVYPQPQRWEQTLIDIHHPSPSDSSIPIFEGMVDLDLSRSQVAPSSAIYKELSLLESELNDNIKALKFTSVQISRRLGRLNILARNPPSREENAGDP
jgi:hypothetical protein